MTAGIITPNYKKTSYVCKSCGCVVTIEGDTNTPDKETVYMFSKKLCKGCANG